MSFEAAAYVFDDPMRLEQEFVFAQGEYRNEGDIYRIISASGGTQAEFFVTASIRDRVMASPPGAVHSPASKASYTSQA